MPRKYSNYQFGWFEWAEGFSDFASESEFLNSFASIIPPIRTPTCSFVIFFLLAFFPSLLPPFPPSSSLSLLLPKWRSRTRSGYSGCCSSSSSPWHSQLLRIEFACLLLTMLVCVRLFHHSFPAITNPSSILSFQFPVSLSLI